MSLNCGAALRSAAIALVFAGAAARARADDAASKPLPAATVAAQTLKSVEDGAPAYIRIFKEESELEVWRARSDGRYVNIKTFPVCRWSGALGPKEKQGDLMTPEGFYNVTAAGLKADSKYHLAMNIGYPNALDRALGRTGDFIMVHGSCESVGCFAMTDAHIEEIFAFVRDAIEGGQTQTPVHVFPFRMTAANMKRHAAHSGQASWAPLKHAYDDFARSQLPPAIGVCDRRYVVNPVAPIDGAADDACPVRIGKLIAPLSPRLRKRLAAARLPLVASGPKMRAPGEIAEWERHRSALGMGSPSLQPPAAHGKRNPDADLGRMMPLLAP
jgi:murein L,D-transpeptidase YafK